MTLNRPAALNCFNQDMFREWREVVEKVAYDRDIRVLVITGSGRAFSSGVDLTVWEVKKVRRNFGFTIVRTIVASTIWKHSKSR